VCGNQPLGQPGGVTAYEKCMRVHDAAGVAYTAESNLKAAGTWGWGAGRPMCEENRRVMGLGWVRRAGRGSCGPV
jgi:hypothetical protein